MDDSKTSSGWSHWITVSIILAALPALGYILAFVYEVEYCRVFNIPREFVMISFTNLIIAIGSILGVSIILLAIPQTPRLINIVGFDKPGLITQRIIKHSIALLLVSVLFLRYYEIESHFYFLYFLPLYYILRDFVLPLITQRSLSGYRNKLKAEDEVKAFPAARIPSFWKKHRYNVIMIIFTLLVLYTVASLDGKRTAIKQEEFLIPSTYPQSVVLKVYGDSLICSNFNRENRTLDGELFFIKLGRDPQLKLSLQTVGPLKLK